MNQKTAPEMFELNEIIAEKQSDKFNKYKDSVKDISEMTDNTESLSNQNNNSSVSEKTYIRLEIARLQHEIEHMKISRDETLVSDKMRVNLTEYLQ
ncbi:hypothetical protein BDDG_12747 [Blastomyces dermatitidis ATCC 18188]|uniref:Uncharacterized protein n=1 Tax=Ajellomyces dermatitidis (strain ATCC 18188 / CBS 674.68) TaxID=653446 RepID=A0A0J9EQK7_AJEDA|nr:hypothetical protein BDDG_12747 [Blastomyces dermatitidis ATCC 18188]